MRVFKSYPPNHEEIVRVFGRNNISNAVFTYGDVVYSPKGKDLPPDLLAHEQEHVYQQELNGPEKWWDAYLKDPKFRLNQELAAYIKQYQYAVEYYSRKHRRSLLDALSKDLAGPMYGRLIKKDEAKRLLEESVR